jgi:hypothetical protein
LFEYHTQPQEGRWCQNGPRQQRDHDDVARGHGSSGWYSRHLWQPMLPDSVTGVQQRALDGGAMAIGDIDTAVGAEALAAAMAQIALSEPHSPSG